ncbi:hypothetical protein CC86DRAFT_363383 [Ophiobolus disseminans]|uniref:Uncharacterized protein n=1 Tax=Ophiobolus disseminans TaxID=1469910 RepID=A0A6A6ZFA0_9PLEO|nr:hypothetical protein CC86DRAFT_363383 [Ophiobolus disseminans]
MDGSAISYATSKDWLDIMKNRSKVRMHELIERLGLRAKWSSNKRGKTNFESALVRDLVADMGDVVATLPKEPDELMKFLSEEGSLKEEVDGLLEKHGTKVWGRAGDREHLLTANEPGVEEGLYASDLYIEEDEDRQLIHKLLHWWIGLKACNVILARERLDRERRKKAESRQARAEAEHANQHGEAPASFVALAPNSVLHDVDTGSRGSPMSSSAMLTPPESGESPMMGPGEGAGFTTVNNGEPSHGRAAAFTAVNVDSLQSAQQQQHQNIADGVWNRFAAGEMNRPRGPGESQAAVKQQIALAEQSAAVERQVREKITQLIVSFRAVEQGPEHVPRSDISIPYRGLDSGSIRALRAYIYNEESLTKVEDEEVLLDRFERVWREHVRADTDKILEDVPSFMARERAFLTWIELKRHVTAFERAENRWASEEGTRAQLERRHQQYHTLMGASETIIANFEDVGQGFGLSTNAVVDKDEVLRQAIVVFAGPKHAVEMQWNNIEFTGIVGWLSEALEEFRKGEEEENQTTLSYVQ